jgi:hypothetical protein
MWVAERVAGQSGDVVSGITEAGDTVSQFSARRTLAGAARRRSRA